MFPTFMLRVGFPASENWQKIRFLHPRQKASVLTQGRQPACSGSQVLPRAQSDAIFMGLY